MRYDLGELVGAQQLMADQVWDHLLGYSEWMLLVLATTVLLKARLSTILTPNSAHGHSF